MGLFDSIGRMFGYGGEQAAAVESESDKFGRLKDKYVAALNAADSMGARLDGLYVEGDKLVVRATAPDQSSAEQIISQFNSIDNSYSDLDLQVNAQQEQQAQYEEADGAAAVQTYTVKSGDSLWKIAKNHYGEGSQYMQIFYANRDKINDPDMIQIGQELIIPNSNQQNA